MTKNELVSRLCKIEGKKSQIKVGDMREVVGVLEAMFADDLYNSGFEIAFAPENEKTMRALIPGINKKLKALKAAENKKSK